MRLQSIRIYLTISIYFYSYYFNVEYVLNLYLSMYDVYILSNFLILFIFNLIQSKVIYLCDAYFRKCFNIFSSICLPSARSCLLLQLQCYSYLLVSILNWTIFGSSALIFTSWRFVLSWLCSLAAAISSFCTFLYTISSFLSNWPGSIRSRSGFL